MSGFTYPNIRTNCKGGEIKVLVYRNGMTSENIGQVLIEKVNKKFITGRLIKVSPLLGL
jgi:hypothetical protein